MDPTDISEAAAMGVEKQTKPNRGIGGHHRAYRGASDDWLTPPDIVEALGPFDLDPCAAPPPRPWSTAHHHIALPEDGLSAEWKGRVWLNPPYGPQTGKWLARLVRHGCGTALIFARTETVMFHRWVWERADGLLFLQGRLHFHYPNGDRAKHNAGGPSVIVAYGERDVAALQELGVRPGHFVRLGGKQ